MPELLLELFSEEIPARMQRRAAEDLKKAVTNALVDDLQRRSFDFFWETTNPSNGLVHDRWPTPSFSSIAAVGKAKSGPAGTRTAVAPTAAVEFGYGSNAGSGTIVSAS